MLLSTVGDFQITVEKNSPKMLKFSDIGKKSGGTVHLEHLNNNFEVLHMGCKAVDDKERLHYLYHEETSP